MTRATRDRAVLVEAAARLHFGVLDLRGALGRRFGGIGASAPLPTLLVSTELTDGGTVDAVGEDATRALDAARTFLRHHGIARGAHVRVHRALPMHAGLGSGTQLALAVARGLAELHGLDTAAPALARALGRGRHSAIGTMLFDAGGLVLEGGRRVDRDDPAPFLARLAIPTEWRCVVALPSVPRAGGTIEELPADLPPAREVERVAHLVLMSLLPALAEGDLATFGGTLTEIQQLTGRWLAAAPHGATAADASNDLVPAMLDWGAAGAGQSARGPTVFGVVGGAEAGAALAARVRDAIGPDGMVWEGPFRNVGAREWSAPAAAPVAATAVAATG
ncbi:beta-ribofuranosylaminobenzene 5'-phosphate synthase family protein [Roseisolibacter agri]|uniref:Beta-ribofuranosylaminobenzene 5'-phosphate synthase n=1 Tax=Roseisolibacter agri TaxID=2014610 RepID=A0AA37Q5T5_9BACT|nr:beta-ribofuranosylaminobenzene 5'-phosphate synthase family protein [Roseisolibacter agri]GLC24287.1 beta-ribofuranosylaminobenzene 5'-phosphate synthase [Roseisolibacter agri]